MNNSKILIQMMEIHKTAFENSFKTLTTVQDSSEKVFFRFVDKNPLFSDNSRKSISDYLSTCRKGRVDFKNSVDESYKKMTDYFSA
jgi:hypothetical protein